MRTEAAGAETPLRDRIESSGGRLRSGLVPILREVAGAAARPSLLTQRLGLDKSLASRLVRALRCESDLELVHRIPSPGGLRMVLVRAKEAGVDPTLIDAASAEVERFQEFIRTTPGGMDAIQAHISDSSQDVRETREHVAKQAAYKAMSFLLGYYCETLTTTLILVPSENGRCIDGIEVHQRVGMHRLRPRTPIALLSVRTRPDEHPPLDSTWIEPLDGQREQPGPEDFLLPEFSTRPIPRLEILREDHHTTFVLEDPAPQHDAGLSLTSAFRIRNGWTRFRTEDDEHAARSYVLPTPCRFLVRELFIAEDVCPGAIPDLSFQLQSPAGPARRRARGLAARINSLDLSAPIEQLRPGPRAFALRGHMQHQEVIAQVFERIGADPSRFRGFRCALAYPVPLVEMVWWLPLPLGQRQP